MRSHLLFLFLTLSAFCTQTPIIGIYTQDRSGNHTYIAASYIKFVEMAGGQVVPIFYKSTEAELKTLLSQINGVLFPGGGMSLDIKNKFTHNADIILKYAKAENDAGRVFPIWATCLGHELVSYLTSGYDSKVLSAVTNQSGVTNTLHFLSKNATCLKNWTTSNYDATTAKPGSVYFNHNWAISTSYFNNNTQLHSFWNLLATTTTSANQTFVSLMEAKQYPFFSCQFHPEKNNFQWRTAAPRKTMDAIEIPQRLAQAFVQKAKQNNNKFKNSDELNQKLIYNYPITLPASDSSFQEIYVFEQK